MNEQIITALDIGSSKLFAVSGLLTSGGLEILGGEVAYPSQEIVQSGRVVDMDSLTNELSELFERMKQIVEEKVEWVVISVGGGHVRGQLYQKEMKIEPAGREITEADIKELDQAIRADVIAADQTGRQILHLLPQQYFVDYQSPTRKAPLGLHAHTLEVRVNAITAAVNPIQDIMQCLKRLDIEVELIFPGAWAAAEAVLNEEEKKLGALVIDLGRGTTNIAVYRDNNLVLTNSFRVGGGHVDSDLCMLLHLPANYAEELKKNHGYCNYDTLAAEKNPVLNEELDVFTPAGRLNRKVTVADLSKIVTERTQDILGKIVRESLVSTRLLPRLSGGVVLTGGSARLKGIVRLAEQIFGLPARIGVPRSRPGLDRSLATPAFSAGIGLLLLAEKDLRREEPESWWERLWRRLSRRR